MQTPTTPNNQRTRPHGWQALLVLCVSCLLIVSPAQMCALSEALSAHAHSHIASHHHENGRAQLTAVPASHSCCCVANSLPIVAPSIAHFDAPDETAPSSHGVLLPQEPDIFARAHYHKRDGPPRSLLRRAQFFLASLPGRAPPFFA